MNLESFFINDRTLQKYFLKYSLKNIMCKKLNMKDILFSFFRDERILTLICRLIIFSLLKNILHDRGRLDGHHIVMFTITEMQNSSNTLPEKSMKYFLFLMTRALLIPFEVTSNCLFPHLTKRKTHTRKINTENNYQVYKT